MSSPQSYQRSRTLVNSVWGISHKAISYHVSRLGWANNVLLPMGPVGIVNIVVGAIRGR
ncbi:hypothetical protein K469DRAFT_590295 [Zopfia rhizophila CBS 207.26]|uniref:Uncharacterized protein n=1 Tax=Zopfia rhizophila CBS 207.26 TaxID=1314779 RepID=A0A6A6DS10_9PEZI|nr:hypothetical protein K469DRAFT_590295 [Zopfia rhizophila CBS 207.26]